jgi:hypothetical protein
MGSPLPSQVRADEIFEPRPHHVNITSGPRKQCCYAPELTLEPTPYRIQSLDRGQEQQSIDQTTMGIVVKQIALTPPSAGYNMKELVRPFRDIHLDSRHFFRLRLAPRIIFFPRPELLAIEGLDSSFLRLSNYCHSELTYVQLPNSSILCMLS